MIDAASIAGARPPELTKSTIHAPAQPDEAAAGAILTIDGEESEIKINPPPGGHEAEFDEWGWRPMQDLPGLIVPFKRKVYEEVVAAFRHLVA